MTLPRYRLVSAPSALRGASPGWAQAMLREGEVALLAGEGLEAVHAIAHDLDQASIPLIREEASPAQQDQTVIAYAESLPLIWIAPEFSDKVRAWARDRGPMTLLVQSDGSLAAEEQHRIERFVAILGRQSE